MKRVFALSVLLAVSLSIVLGTQSAHAAVSDWQKGISIQSRYSTDFGSASFRQSIDNAAKIGVNYVTLIIPVHQDNIYSSYVYAGGDTPTDDSLRGALAYIKSKNMNSAVAIHNNPYDNQWRAFINGGDKNTWFATYGSLLTKYASIAQAGGSTQMIIGTELSSMTVPENTSRWTAMIQSVRSVFSGSLTYSAQRSGYMADAQTLGFWPQLDKVGLSAYYGLGSDGSQQSLENAWSMWDKQEISVLAAKYNKPIIFTEVGYVSRDNATNDPGTGYMLGTNLNMGLQANAYQALFNYWNNKPTVQGVFFWDWSSDPNAGGTNDGGYTPQNKPAQSIMQTWFSTPATSTTIPTQTIQPTTSPQSAKYTIAAGTPSSLISGSSVTIPVSVSASSAVPNVLVDVEVYNDKDQRVAQYYVDNQSLDTSAKNYPVSWTPQYAGSYTIKAGIFMANWQSNVTWNGSVSSVSIVTPTQTTPVVTPPNPVPTSTPTPAPTPVVPPVSQPSQPATSLPTDIAIWWPGGTVSGVQPFKAIINGRDISTYDIYWQVDGGVLNKLGEDNTPIPHKESLVDLTNWKWNGSHQYVINFVAKNKTGNMISQKQTTLTIY